MARVRGTFVLSSVEFVRTRDGPEAHPAVLAAMPKAEGLAFATRLPHIRDSSWEPFDPVRSYLETAESILAANDPGFHREMGRFAARAALISGFSAMVSGIETAVRMIPVMARAFIDVGRIEVTQRSPTEIHARLYDFPPVRCLCERRRGAWEVLLASGGRAPAVSETECVTAGHPCCELRVLFRPE